MTNICVFEDDGYKDLLPLTYTRAVYELRCGIDLLWEKIARQYGKASVNFHARPYLQDIVKHNHPAALVNGLKTDTCLFLNGRILPEDKLAKSVPIDGPDEIFVKGDQIAAFRIRKDTQLFVKDIFSDLIGKKKILKLLEGRAKVSEVEVKLIRYPWDVVHCNSGQIVYDFKFLAGHNEKIKGTVYEGAHLLNKKEIHIGVGSKIKPGAALDAGGGPVYIGENVEVMPNAVIIGPAYIGSESKIKAGAKVYEGTSIGPVCKIGGEVEESIFQSYSNKQHEGFIGHSYIGSWVNLGADTNNSDLKNNYGNVKVSLGGQIVDTGLTFVGSTIADHSKTGINTMLNTGTVIGVASNVFGSGFPPKEIPSFSWGGAEKLEEYKLEKALEVAGRAMKRRKIDMTEADKELFRKIFELTAAERKRAGIS